jgi:Cu(I)/Ag(I) efflux system membrane fusion protein
MIIKIIELRLRFVVLMVMTSLAFAYAETLWNRYEKWARPHGEPTIAPIGPESFCPMHPSVVQNEPGKCPICGMPLATRKKGEATRLPKGVFSRVQLTPLRVAQAGIRTVSVDFAPRSERIRTFGLVGFDEGRRSLVASDSRGRVRVDRLHVLAEGTTVRSGQHLAELYSYDVAQAIRVYLDAVRARKEQRGALKSSVKTPLSDPEERVRIATMSLKVLGVRREQIDALDGSSDCLPVLAPMSGVIVRNYIRAGQVVTEGSLLFEVADLSRVWVEAGVFEDKLGGIAVDSPIEAAVPAFPGLTFTGSVSSVSPTIDQSTRTASVRFALDNTDLRLRPGMFATVTIAMTGGRSPGPTPATCPVTGARLGSMGPAVAVKLAHRTVRLCCAGCESKLRSTPDRYLARRVSASAGEILSVPESAVIDTGTKTVVYVETQPGVFEGRAVMLGPRSGDSYPVLDGLAPGQRVAVAGAFLIDAESRLDPATSVTPAPERDAPIAQLKTSLRPDGFMIQLRP